METTEGPLKRAGISCHWKKKHFKDSKTSGPMWKTERDINHTLYLELANQLAAKQVPLKVST